MLKSFFERDYGHLEDSEDWTKVFGNFAHPGQHTVGDIRKELERFPFDASLRLDSSGASFYVTNVKSKLFIVEP